MLRSVVLVSLYRLPASPLFCVPRGNGLMAHPMDLPILHVHPCILMHPAGFLYTTTEFLYTHYRSSPTSEPSIEMYWILWVYGLMDIWAVLCPVATCVLRACCGLQ